MNVSEENILNVTLLEPREKHPTIFNRFDLLREGESLTIHNDHDPKPLYYQLLGERGDIFVWEYLEKGPEWWKVRMTKRITGENDQSLGQIVAKDFHKAAVFKKYGLDFCCGGKKTVKEACADKGIDAVAVEHELQQADKNVTALRPLPYDDWSITLLADFIVQTHHSYIKKTFPDIRIYAAKVAKVHGHRHPELIAIYEQVEKMNPDLWDHLLKEESVLFPYIKQLEEPGENDLFKKSALAGHIQYPINTMEAEHEEIATCLSIIRRLSNNYQLPDDACASYSLLFKMLHEFEDDMQMHVHLENNILFPKAIALERNKN